MRGFLVRGFLVKGLVPLFCVAGLATSTWSLPADESAKVDF